MLSRTPRAQRLPLARSTLTLSPLVWLQTMGSPCSLDPTQDLSLPVQPRSTRVNSVLSPKSTTCWLRQPLHLSLLRLPPPPQRLWVLGGLFLTTLPINSAPFQPLTLVSCRSPLVSPSPPWVPFSTFSLPMASPPLQPRTPASLPPAPPPLTSSGKPCSRLALLAPLASRSRRPLDPSPPCPPRTLLPPPLSVSLRPQAPCQRYLQALPLPSLSLGLPSRPVRPHPQASPSGTPPLSSCQMPSLPLTLTTGHPLLASTLGLPPTHLPSPPVSLFVSTLALPPPPTWAHRMGFTILGLWALTLLPLKVASWRPLGSPHWRVPI